MELLFAIAWFGIAGAIVVLGLGVVVAAFIVVALVRVVCRGKL